MGIVDTPTADKLNVAHRIKDLMLEKDGAEVVVSTFGAHILSWKAAGHERLWMSEAAVFDGSKAIRGGVPIAFPIFGSDAEIKLPSHGVARITTWDVAAQSKDSATLVLKDTDLDMDYAEAWPSKFSLEYTISLREANKLELAIKVTNTGSAPLAYNILFHPYWRVDDISRVQVDGFTAPNVFDKVAQANAAVSADSVGIAGPTDAVYERVDVRTATIRQDGRAVLRISHPRLKDRVLWNPWESGAAGMGDFAPKDAYKHMVCVEPGNVSGGKETLASGHSATVGLVAEALL